MFNVGLVTSRIYLYLNDNPKGRDVICFSKIIRNKAMISLSTQMLSTTDDKGFIKSIYALNLHRFYLLKKCLFDASNGNKLYF